MKNMKFNLLGVFAVAIMLFFAGCADECKDVDCGDNGTCVTGDCVCDDGYEGTNCGSMINAKFAGTYNLTETCNPTGNAGPYAITVAASSSTATGLSITGLWEEAGVVCTAEVSTTSTSTFTIAKQSYSNGNYMIEGNGTYVEATGSIEIDYTIYDAAGSTTLDECGGTMAAQ